MILTNQNIVTELASKDKNVRTIAISKNADKFTDQLKGNSDLNSFKLKF